MVPSAYPFLSQQEKKVIAAYNQEFFETCCHCDFFCPFGRQYTPESTGVCETAPKHARVNGDSACIFGNRFTPVVDHRRPIKTG